MKVTETFQREIFVSRRQREIERIQKDSDISGLRYLKYVNFDCAPRDTRTDFLITKLHLITENINRKFKKSRRTWRVPVSKNTILIARSLSTREKDSPSSAKVTFSIWNLISSEWMNQKFKKSRYLRIPVFKYVNFNYARFVHSQGEDLFALFFFTAKSDSTSMKRPEMEKSIYIYIYFKDSGYLNAWKRPRAGNDWEIYENLKNRLKDAKICGLRRISSDGLSSS